MAASLPRKLSGIIVSGVEFNLYGCPGKFNPEVRCAIVRTTRPISSFGFRFRFSAWDTSNTQVPTKFSQPDSGKRKVAGNYENSRLCHIEVETIKLLTTYLA